MKKSALVIMISATFILGMVSSGGCSSVDGNSAPPKQELGIDRSHLSQQSLEVQQKSLSNIHTLGAKWFRDGPTSGSSRGVANFVQEAQLAKQQGLKILVDIMQMDEDYDTALPVNQLGWKEKKLSQINLNKYADRLRNLFGALKAANVEIDAVEFGNEDDQCYYDADVPQGHASTASQEEIMSWLRGYGQFLKVGAEVLHDPHYFPERQNHNLWYCTFR